MLAVHTGEVGALALEELVAGRAETLPHGIRMAARHGPDLLPAGLQGDQFVGGLLPLLASGERLGRLAQFKLQLQVVLHLGLHTGIELPLGLEEAVAGRAETLVDAVVVLLRGETDRLPCFLDLEQTVAGPVPLLARGEGLGGQLLGGHAQFGLQPEVLHLFGLQRLEVLLVLLVDAARRGLEALPERLLVFVGDGARLAPLVMEFLQLVECLDNRRLEQQGFGLLTEGHLLLVVLLQIEVAQLLVDLDEVVEVLDMQVVGLPQVLDLLLGHDARLLPALLEFAELRERMVERLVRIDQFLELLDDLEFDLEVALLLGLEVGDELVAAAAVFTEQLLELRLDAIDGRCEILLGSPLLDEAAAGSLNLGAAQTVEGDLQRLDIAADRLHGLLLEHPGKQPHQLLLALSGETVFGRLLAGGTLGGVLLGGCLVQFESGAPRGQGGILVREIDLYIGRSLVLIGFRLHRLRHGFDPGTFGTRLRRVGLGLRRCGQFGLYGISSRFGSSLHILSHGADLLLGSRKVRFFSSHLSTRF